MKRTVLVSMMMMLAVGGCYSDVTVTKELKTLDRKCIHIGQIDCNNPRVAKILRDCLQKEFIKAKLDVCDEDTATMIMTGDVFMTTEKEFAGSGWFGSYGSGGYVGGKEALAIDSTSFQVKTKDGRLLAVASYNNWVRERVERVGHFLGYDLASKLKK